MFRLSPQGRQRLAEDRRDDEMRDQGKEALY